MPTSGGSGRQVIRCRQTSLLDPIGAAFENYLTVVEVCPFPKRLVTHDRSAQECVPLPPPTLAHR